ncbi:hypothetical protein DFH08DRAFT_807269 [Mycena albidolilacea]|uniref:Uncharacterized protein n=1 Tax=Mycena albidolilacea TaxID=1033008 RepID=A0AAD7ET32_9AGAR|nr:hypothetical protein DFH08DRAFT_807269 [Mycena albidolilacea]
MTKLAKSHYKSLLLWKRRSEERARVIPDDDQPNKRRRIGDRSEDQSETALHSYSLSVSLFSFANGLTDAQKNLTGPRFKQKSLQKFYVVNFYIMREHRAQMTYEGLRREPCSFCSRNKLDADLEIYSVVDPKVTNFNALKLPDANYEFITVDRTLRTWPVNADAEPYFSDMVGQFMVNDFIVFDKDDNRVLPTDIPHMLKPDTMVECLFELQYHHINGTHSFTEQVHILRPAIEAVPSPVKASPSKPYRPPAMSKLQFQQCTAIAEPSSSLAATAGPSHASDSKSSQKRKASEESEGSAPKRVNTSGGKDRGSSLNQ